MGRMPAAVMTHPLDLTWQAIFTWVSWAIVLAMIAIAVWLGRRQRTPFYLFAVLAAGVAAFAEPLYDVAFDLWFYDAHRDGSPGAMWSHFTAFGVVQPNCTPSERAYSRAASPTPDSRKPNGSNRPAAGSRCSLRTSHENASEARPTGRLR